jgi:hypothetical protein
LRFHSFEANNSRGFSIEGLKQMALRRAAPISPSTAI